MSLEKNGVRLLASFFLIFAIQTTFAADLRSYDNFLSLTPEANLSFTTFLTENVVSISVSVRDTSVVSLSDNWLGIGIGEPSSGSMVGADILTVHFPVNSTSTCRIVDRYVPFAAYPLGETPGVYPLEDDCTDSDWKLVSCVRDPVTGKMDLEVDRPIQVQDKRQDRDITPGTNVFMYSYGSNFEYHGNRRHSSQVTFYEDPTINTLIDIPPDVDGSFELLNSNYKIPSKDTTYSAISFRAPRKKGTQRSIIAVEPVFTTPDHGMVHHYTIFLCSGKKYFRLGRETFDTEFEPYGPLGNSMAICTTLFYGWAKGGSRVVFPPNVGVTIDDDSPFITMETHFDNPQGLEDVIDRSGIRIFYTDTVRPIEAGSLFIGDAMVQLRSEDPIKSGHKYEFTCASSCTKRFSEPVTLFSSFFHMHTTGKEIYTNKFDENNNFTSTIGKINFWSDRFQKTVPLPNSTVLYPGEQLQTACIYDTSKRPETQFGIRTLDEMCMHLLMYYPLQKDNVTGHELNICTLLGDSESNTSFCGDHGRFNDFDERPELFPFESQNPLFIDPVGAPTDFATSGATCAPSPVLSPFPSIVPIPNPEDPTEPEDDGNVSTEDTTGEPSEDSTEPEDDENVCFPGSALVETKGGKVIRMEAVKIGMEVKTSRGFSVIFTTSHSEQERTFKFVRLSYRGARNGSLSLTGGHYLYVSGSLKRAREARVGDWLQLGGGGRVNIIEKDVVPGRGLFNPHTMVGDIVVDGVVCSTYTEAVAPMTAAALLAPLRWLQQVFGVAISLVGDS